MANAPTKIARRIATSALALAVVMSSLLISSSIPASTANAACAALPTTYGQTVNTVYITTAGSYTVYVRLKTPTSSVNSVWLQIDQSLCSVKMGGSSTDIPVNAWKWVGYSGGNIGSLVTTTLSAGNHTVTLAGTGNGLEVDQLLLTQNCIPNIVGGTNCTNPPVVVTPNAPVVSINASPTSLTTGSGSTITWSATNTPTSCTATNDWTGSKSITGGTYSTGVLSTARTYTYTLTCQNAGGSGSKSATVIVTAPIVYQSADINRDGVVNLLDWSVFRPDFGKSAAAASNRRSDINGDGTVNLLDFSILAKQLKAS